MKSAIVTGANGFIGSTLVKKLLDNHIRVLAIDVNFNKIGHLNKENLTLLENNLSDLELVKASIKDNRFDTFYHFAWRGVNGKDKADPDIQIQNIQTAVNAARLAKNLNCDKFLCSGTIAERGLSSLPNLKKTTGGMLYCAAKHGANMVLETYCKSIDLNFVWMQFSNIYGPQNKTGNLISYTVSELQKDNDAEFGPANQPYDFVYIDDLIEAIYRLGTIKTKKSFYYIGSGEPRILKDYLLEIGEIMNKKENIKIGTRKDDGIVYTQEMFDNSSLVCEIGQYVSTSFSDGIRITLNY